MKLLLTSGDAPLCAVLVGNTPHVVQLPNERRHDRGILIASITSAVSNATAITINARAVKGYVMPIEATPVCAISEESAPKRVHTKQKSGDPHYPISDAGRVSLGQYVVSAALDSIDHERNIAANYQENGCDPKGK